MTAFGSGVNFLSGLAVHLGLLSALDLFRERRAQKKQKRRARAGDHYRPLSERQKRELLESIRYDDWFE